MGAPDANAPVSPANSSAAIAHLTGTKDDIGIVERQSVTAASPEFFRLLWYLRNCFTKPWPTALAAQSAGRTLLTKKGGTTHW